MDNGLHITDLGARGLIVETHEPAYSLARARHACLQRMVNSATGLSPGAVLVIQVIVDGLILHRSTLDVLVTPGRSRLYRNGSDFEVELDMPGGWRDRRILPGSVVEAIRANRGVVVERKQVAEAAAAIRSACGITNSADSLTSAIADAQAWWFSRLPGPLFAHASRHRPFQLLNRAARARITHRCPQRADPCQDDGFVESIRQAFDDCFAQTGDVSVVQDLVHGFGRIAREHRAKAQGVVAMKDLVDRLMPRAVGADLNLTHRGCGQKLGLVMRRCPGAADAGRGCENPVNS